MRARLRDSLRRFHRSRGWPVRYALAFLAVGLVWASRERILQESLGQSPFLAFGLAILVTGLLGGFGPGLLATLLSAILAVFFYLPPYLALTVGAPVDLVQLGLFVAEGIVAATAGGMVREALLREEATDHAERRFARFLRRADVLRGRSAIAAGPLVEDLTEREREVAGLLALGLDNEAIAAALFVSRNTVKTHLRHIYEKLGARSRTEAVARCIELGLLAPAADGLAATAPPGPRSRRGSAATSRGPGEPPPHDATEESAGWVIPITPVGDASSPTDPQA
jgi:DNA-binding CsgD family transcriptional regulator